MDEFETYKCKHAVNCAMFDLFAHQGTLAVWKINYCDSNYLGCVRYTMSESGEVPADEMLPNGKMMPIVK